jgi:translation initiation factor 3 subunit B
LPRLPPRRYSRRYEEEDEALLAQADTEFLAERAREVAAWRDWLGSKSAWVEEQAAGAIRLLGDRYKGDSEYTVKEVEVTVTLDTKEEPAKLA